MKIQKVTDPGFPQIRKGSGGIQFRSASEGDEAYTGSGGCGICSVSRGAGSSRCGKRAEKTERLVDYLSRSDIVMVNNKKLNALEYHRNSEINVAVTDLVLLIGHQQDIEEDLTYDTSKVEAFLVPAGTGIEVYATTLHYAPCHVNESGFQCVVVLPRGTNTEIDFPMSGDGEDGLMTARNKWLIAHEDAKIEGAFNGLKGENITLD